MLSKILSRPQLTTLYKRNQFKRQTLTRCFSTEIQSVSESTAPVLKPTAPGTLPGKSGSDINQILANLETQDHAKEADYLKMLDDTDAR